MNVRTFLIVFALLSSTVIFCVNCSEAQGVTFPGGSVTWGYPDGGVNYPGGSVSWGQNRGGVRVQGGDVGVNWNQYGNGGVNINIPGSDIKTNIRW